MQTNYWTKVLQRRVTRRKALGRTASAAGVAAFMAACGGDDDDSSTGTGQGTGAATSSGSTPGSGSGAAPSTTQSGLITQPEDTTNQAVRGGTLKGSTPVEAPSLDPATASYPLNFVSGYVLGMLFSVEPGHLEPQQDVMFGDLAEGWEESADRLELTIKLKPGVKWHNKAPVNGREVDIDDVLYSWQRYTEVSPISYLVYNGNNPAAPVLSVDAVDPSTLSVKLAEPLSYAIRHFAHFGTQSGNLVMLPKEADGGYEPRGEMIGHGPYELSSVDPSVGYTLTRNPAYWDADSFYIEQIDLPIVPEYASRLAQLKAGNIHRLVAEASLAVDLLSVKDEQPDLGIYETDFTTSLSIMVFGQLPEGESPFQDERVRQAISMGLDREIWIKARSNTDFFEANGLPTETRWNSHMTADWDGYWLDPQSSEFGENAKYFQFNIPEAKKLLTAAGFPDGFKVTSNYPVQGLSFASTAEPTDGMLRELGLEIAVNNPGYAEDYIPNYRDGKGQFEGWSYATVLGTLPNSIHPVASLVAEYWPRGGLAFRGFSANGMNDQSGDPTLSAMLEKARLEPDTEALKSQLQDIQRYLAKAMWGLLMPGGATSFNMAWPAVRNHQVWRTSRQGNYNGLNPYKLWIDESQPPFV